MTKEETLFQRRLLDLADTAWQRGAVLFTDFLNLNEQDIFFGTRSDISYIKTIPFGGYDAAERKMIAFVPELYDHFDDTDSSELNTLFPMDCLKVEPLNRKFSDTLTHRDYLGSLMNLGIDRSKIGDILVEEQSAFIICHRSLSDYICSSLSRIKHTSVNCVVEADLIGNWVQKTENITGTVASLRLDTLLSLCFNSSRSSLSSLIEEGKVFVNGKMITSNGYHIKDNDLISARGYGKFRFLRQASITKKGRCLVEIEKYI